MPQARRFEDVISIDPAFLARIERLFPGRDFESPEDAAPQARHVVDQVRPRRGAHGRPHEPLQHDVRPVLHGREPGRLRPRARVGRHPEDPGRRRSTVKPRRQLSVQFSGGEPTLSPAFPRRRSATRARSATSACSARRTAFASRRSRSSASEAKAAGLRLCYLQFDGVSNEANAHRKIGNLFDVKLRAIENLAAAGIDVVLVVTVVERREQRPGRADRRVRDRQRRQDHGRRRSSR